MRRASCRDNLTSLLQPVTSVTGREMRTYGVVPAQHSGSMGWEAHLEASAEGLRANSSRTPVRNNPARIPYGTSGHLGTVHLAMELFRNAAQLKMIHVPYQGGGPAFNALLSDQVPVVPTLESIGKGQLDAGNIRVPAQWGTERLAGFSARADAAGGGISGGDLHPLGRRVRAEKN